MKYKSYSLSNYHEIPQIDKLTFEQRYAIEVVGNVLPFKVNNYVLNELINWSDVQNDPIYKLTFPQTEMLSATHFMEVATVLFKNVSKDEIKKKVNEIRLQLNPHPANQVGNIPRFEGKLLTGIQHKYKQTVLFFPSKGQTCHAYCTFCFRWPQFVGMDEIKFAMKESEVLADYVQKNKSVTDVLFTGGDPLIMKASVLRSYIKPLLDRKIDNLQTIRIGTKALSYWPYRFTTDEDCSELLQLFEEIVNAGVNLSIMAHFSHPVELKTQAVEDAIRKIRGTGAQIRTQSPVLKHINDNPKAWSDMWRKQVNLGCIPYYMFIPRDTGAQDYFAVTLEDAWNIFRKAYQKVSGICRTVRGPSMSTEYGKIQVLGINELNEEKIFVLRMLQGKNPDWVAKPFFAEYNNKAIWLSDLKPYQSEQFFFQDKMEFENSTL